MRVLPVLALAGILVSALAGCNAAPTCTDCGGIDDFPPLPSDHPPGASVAARATAAGFARGVNFGNMLEAPVEGDWGLEVTPEFIDSAAAVGFESVRLPVRWSNHAEMSRPFTIDHAFLVHVDTIVDRLLGKGLYVVLNMHHYRQLDGDPPEAGEQTVYEPLVEERFIRMWVQIAEHFSSRSDHLVFELYNEPHGRLGDAAWNVLAARALGAVRRSNPSRIVVIGPVWNSAGALEWLRLPNDANLIVTVHNYDPASFTHQGASWAGSPPTGVTCCNAAQVSALTAPLETARVWSEAHHYPVFLGEFGAYEAGDMASRARFTRAMRDAAESRGITWTYWEFAAGFGVYDPQAHVFRPALRDALLGS